MVKNEYDEEITDEIGSSDYGDKKAQCGKCKKDIVVHTDWLANVYEESIAFYECPHCKDRSWYYI